MADSEAEKSASKIVESFQLFVIMANYECENDDCGATFTPEEMFDLVCADFDEAAISDLLLGIEDLGPLGAFGEGSIGSVNVGPLNARCSNCGEDSVQINVSVRATPVYTDYDGHTDKMPQVDYFEDTVIEEVLPSDVGLDVSLTQCFQCHDEDESDYLPDLEEHDLTEEFLQLRVIVKTKMNNGFCYMGWDMNEHRLVRPILRTGTSQCCWRTTDPPLQVGEMHRFQITCRHPPEIPHPHRTNDVQLEYRQRLDESPDIPSLYNLLVSHSRQNVMDVFGDNNIVQKKYVIEGTECPSVGIYRCKGKNLQLYTSKYINGKSKKRCTINPEAGNEGAVGGDPLSFDFPITCLDVNDSPDDDINVLVILGLGRPFDGNGQFQPKRCYILIIGIISEQLQGLEKTFSELRL